MRLFLMRHASTEWTEEKNDFERELAQKGKEEAAEGAKFLADFQIDKVIVSYAKRTIATADIILDSVIIKEKEIVAELYQGNASAAIDLIANQPSHYENIMVIGHNPTIFKTALLLADQSGGLYDSLMTTSMPPARIIVIDFNIEKWCQISDNKGKITRIFTPR